MTERNYTKRELDMKFAEGAQTSTDNANSIMAMIAKNDTDYRSSFTRIELKQDQTNGKVAKVTEDFNKWKWLTIGGGVVVIFVLGTILIPLVSAFITASHW